MGLAQVVALLGMLHVCSGWVLVALRKGGGSPCHAISGLFAHPLGCPVGPQAWMRSRGDAGVTVFTSDDVADRYGVVKGR